MELKVTHWLKETPPTAEELEEQLVEEELNVHHWSSPAQSELKGHTHGHHKVLYVLSGSIKFELPTRHKTIDLKPGDRLDLPAGVRHIAVVGINGVTCLEAHVY